MTNSYAAMNVTQLAAEYRIAYANHQQLAQEYAEGRGDASELRASANNLKAIRVAFAAESEANKVRRH